MMLGFSGSLHSQPLTATNLPLVLLETNGQNIDFEPVSIFVKIIDNGAGALNHPDDPPTLTTHATIRLRGNYSSILPQKPYALELKDPATGLDTAISVLGLPKEEDWILLANWNDKSFARNPLLFHLSRQLGRWAPHTVFVEVLLDGEYQGIYTFCEKIKRDANRVAIQKLTPQDNSLPKLSGGYIFKHDYGWDFTTDNWHPSGCQDRWLNFEFEYPKASEITQSQRDYLSGYLDDFEETLFSSHFQDPQTGYRQLIDADSWMDYFLLSELSGNVDAYKKSMYFHKDRDGLLQLGPVWDFDWAMKFLWENSFPNGAGWLYTIDPCTQDVLYVPYFQRLMKDTAFRQQVCDRWQALRLSHLDTVRVFQYIDSVALLLAEAKDRHFQQWKCLGYDSGAPELPPYPTTYEGEVHKLKQFLRQRIAWMDIHLPLACFTKTEQPVEDFEAAILPNFGNRLFTLRLKGIKKEGNAFVFDAAGRLCNAFSVKNGDNPLALEHFPAGVYFLKIKESDQSLTRRFVITP
jgi:hypothetical protein